MRNRACNRGKSGAACADGGLVDRAALIHQARVYMAQCRATQHREWKITLLNWACNVTREAMQPKPMEQLELI